MSETTTVTADALVKEVDAAVQGMSVQEVSVDVTTTSDSQTLVNRRTSDSLGDSTEATEAKTARETAECTTSSRNENNSPPRDRARTPPPNPAVRLPRNRSSPSLLDASPKQTSQAPLKLRGNELTPVMRNTSEFVEESYVVVSPDDLALPNSKMPVQTLQRRPSAEGPPFMPETAAAAQRAKSVGNLDMHSMVETARSQEEEEEQTMHDPIRFPSRRFYSFNGQLQYRRTVQEAEDDDDTEELSTEGVRLPAGLIPYQPSRDNSLSEICNLPREELSSIFNTTEESSLHRAIPLEERQWSIPSIRLANHVDNSTTSYTDDGFTDEEDDYRYDDDASLSSRGSSLCLPDEDAAVLRPQGERPVVIEDGLDQVVHLSEDDSSSAAVALSSVAASLSVGGDIVQIVHEKEEESSPATEGGKAEPRRKKRSKKAGSKEQQAYEWLRTVEIGRENDFFAEAASSKFLTGGVQASKENVVGLAVPPRPPLAQQQQAAKNRRLSSPPSLAQNETADAAASTVRAAGND